MAVDDQKTSSFEKMPPPSLPLKAAKANPNATIALPSMEAFEEMARVASTPYHGRRTFDDDDEDEVDPNTCAVDIVFKKPKEQQPRPQEETQHQQQQPQPEQEMQRLVPLSPLMETSREYKSSSSSGGQSLMTTTQNAALTKADLVLVEGAVAVTMTAAEGQDRREDVGEDVGAELLSPGMREEE